MKNINKKSGFTLFELLVSISIIAVMTAVAVVSFGGVSKRSRDARRMADLEKIRLALETVRQVGGSYPIDASSAQTALVPTYLQQWPVDPKSGISYFYVKGAINFFTYQIGASVEDLGSTNSPSFACGTINCNYKVVNP